MSDDFTDWLRENPAPDLQELVRQYGGYDKITPAAWVDWDNRVADWRVRCSNRQSQKPAIAKTAITETGQGVGMNTRANPFFGHCECGLPGMFVVKINEKWTWYCAEHRLRGFTLWRSIRIALSVPPPHDCVSDPLGGKQSENGVKDVYRREE